MRVYSSTELPEMIAGYRRMPLSKEAERQALRGIEVMLERGDYEKLKEGLRKKLGDKKTKDLMNLYFKRMQEMGRTEKLEEIVKKNPQLLSKEENISEARRAFSLKPGEQTMYRDSLDKLFAKMKRGEYENISADALRKHPEVLDAILQRADVETLATLGSKAEIRDIIQKRWNEIKKKQEKISNLRENHKSQNAEGILLDSLNRKGFFSVADDPFKGLKISDAVFDYEQLFSDSILRYGMTEKNLPVYYEMLKTDAENIEFTVSTTPEFDKLSSNIIKTMNIFYKKLAINEVNWYKTHKNTVSSEFIKRFTHTVNSAITKENKCLIRFGFGSGQWSMTLQKYWKRELKTKALWNKQLLGWALLEFKEI